jgi:hypothetical protein
MASDLKGNSFNCDKDFNGEISMEGFQWRDFNGGISMEGLYLGHL